MFAEARFAPGTHNLVIFVPVCVQKNLLTDRVSSDGFEDIQWLNPKLGSLS